jgi:hypothetical protein
MTGRHGTDEPPKLIDVADFRAQGYLQELNRRFLHPLGLSMSIEVAEDGAETLAGIWDYREDPEGILYAGGADRTKFENIEREWSKRVKPRVAAIGFMVQPVGVEPKS